MRLVKYLNEKAVNIISNDYQGVMDILEKDCGTFLTEVKYAKKVLYRGVPGEWVAKWRTYKEYDKSHLIHKKIARMEDRHPLNTSQSLHDKLNNAFQKRFGWKVRNGVFASSDIEDAESYGEPWLFFPIGKYKFVWSPYIHDLFLFTHWMDNLYDEELFRVYKNTFSRKTDDVEEVFNGVIQSYTDEYMMTAIKSGNEISFNCSSYYIVDNDNELKTMLF